MIIRKFSLALVGMAASISSYAQLDCSGGRYVEPIFPTFTETTNITFGSNTNINGQEQTLTLDVFQPDNDNLAQRPLIIFVHGGTFITGTKDDGDVTELCKRFAKLGYVTASINYRLGMGIPSQTTAAQALLRAVHDMKAAVRFFRQDAATSNTYRINPDYIMGGGSSAGALTALHLAYLDQPEEVPNYVDTTDGGLEGNSGNPGYPSNIRAVINLCGALADSSWLNAGDEPVVSVHGDEDGTVPYGTQTITVFGIPILPVSGSLDVHARALNVGVTSALETFPGQDHVPYATNGTYMDSTYWFVRDFLADIVCNGLSATPENQVASGKLIAYPNPTADGSLTVAIAGGNLKNTTVQLVDISGRLVYENTITADVTKHMVNTANLNAGLYIVKTSNAKGTQTQKLVIQ